MKRTEFEEVIVGRDEKTIDVLNNWSLAQAGCKPDFSIVNMYPIPHLPGEEERFLIMYTFKE